MMLLAALAAFFILGLPVAQGRDEQALATGYRFFLGSPPTYNDSTSTCSWPVNLTGIQITDLAAISPSQASTPDECAATACASWAQVWQWCPNGTQGCATTGESCWIGALGPNSFNNSNVISFARTDQPDGPAPPAPQQCVGAANAVSPVCPTFDDSAWRTVSVPHDFVIEGAVDEACDRNHGYLCTNVSFYRLSFTVPSSWANGAADGVVTQPTWLDFDGVYRASDYWLDGVWVGHMESGYAPFRWFLHNVSGAPLTVGSQHTLAVRVDALSHNEGWFYEGGGIYRSVTLRTAPDVFLQPWGVYLPSHVDVRNISTDAATGAQYAPTATILAQADIEYSTASGGIAARPYTLTHTVLDASGAVVGTVTSSGTISPGGWARVSTPVTVSPAQLWNTRVPYLYIVTTTLTATGAGAVATTTDAVNTTIGIRNAIFTADQGLVLNGVPTKIQGFSNHMDVGGLGTAVPDRVQGYRVALLKGLGANGWRTAHNPVNAALLDACDAHGMLVWAENRNLERTVIGAPAPEPTAVASSDRRRARATVVRASNAQLRLKHDIVGPDGTVRLRAAALRDTPIDPATFPDPLYVAEAAAMVLRDRNHPSIVLWSLCNEGGCFQGDPLGGIVASAFKNAILDIDGSRPITANSEDVPGDRLTRVVDIESFSYNYGEYDAAHQRYPWKPVCGGESASCTSDRAYYLPTNMSSGHVAADDLGCVVNAWQSAASRPWVIGNFAWTGLDYHGEETPTNWPAVSSHFGVIDLGFYPKDSAGYYRAWWAGNASAVSTLPSQWTDPVPAGTNVSVAVFTPGAYAQLFIDGVDVAGGPLPVPQWGYASFPPVAFKPGNLTAVSFDATGRELARTTLLPVAAPAALRLSCDAGSCDISADGVDVAMVRVEVIDADGNLVPSAGNTITFAATGPGDVIGLHNGDPTDHTPEKVGQPDLPYGGVWWRYAYGGLARAFVRSQAGAAGAVTLTATSPGLATATLTINTL